MSTTRAGLVRAILVLALATAALGGWWWLDAQRDVAAIAEAPRRPDSYFRELDMLRHDENGRPEMRVQADYAEHFENETWVHLHALDARGLAAGPDWRLRADRGRLSDDGVALDAWGNVVLIRGGATQTQPMRLETPEISMNTQTETAVTDAAVRITQGDSVITGRGLWVSLADDRLRIEADVEARYVR